MGDVLREGAKVVGTACGDDLKALQALLGRNQYLKQSFLLFMMRLLLLLLLLLLLFLFLLFLFWFFLLLLLLFVLVVLVVMVAVHGVTLYATMHNPCAEKTIVSGKEWNFFPHSECSHCHAFIQRLRNTPTRMGLRFSLSTLYASSSNYKLSISIILDIYIIYIRMIHLCITSSIPSSSSWASPILTSIFHSLSSYGRVSGSAGSFWWATTLRQWAQHPACGDSWIWCTNPLSSCS